MTVKPIGTWILFCSAASLLASPLVFAQAGGSTRATNSPSTPGLGSTSEDPNAPHSFADQAFVRSTLERGNAELQLAQLAAEKGQSDDVKALGQHIVDGTNRVDDGFKAVANAINLGLPKEPSKKDKQAIAKIQALTGPQFDEEYLKLVLKYKRQDVKEFQLESGSAEDPNVQHAAAQDAPLAEAHVKEIEQVAHAHNIPTEGKN